MNNSPKQPQNSFFQGFPKVRWRYAHWYLLTAQAITLHIWLTIFYFSPRCNVESLSPVEWNCRPYEPKPCTIPAPTDCYISPSCEHTLPPPPPLRFIQLKNPTVENHVPPPPPPKLDFNSVSIPIKQGEESGCFCGVVEDAELAFIYDGEKPETHTFILEDEEPVAVNLNEIKREIGYPLLAREVGIMGSVVFNVKIDETGKYIEHGILQKVHPILSDEIEKHIHKVRYTPAIRSGHPVKEWVKIPFNFCMIN